MIGWLTSDRTMEAGWQILVLVVLRSTLLMAALLLVLWQLRAAAAAVRARILAAGMLGLLAVPLLSLGLPALPLRLSGFPTVLFEERVWFASGADLTSSASSTIGGWVSAVAALPVVTLALIVWGVGSAVLLLRFIVRSARIRGVARRGEAGHRACTAALTAARRRMGIDAHRAVRVALTPHTRMPVVFGWRRHTILLPLGARSWSGTRLETVLCHELAHVARRDYVWLVVSELVSAAYWPNPLVRRVRTALRLEQDKAADGAAVQAGLPATDYAAELLALARGLPNAHAGAALPIISGGRHSPLVARIRALLDRRSGTPQRNRGRTATALAVLLASALLVAAADPWQCDEEATAGVIVLPGITVH